MGGSDVMEPQNSDPVVVWWMDVREVSEATLLRWHRALDEEEQAKAESFHFAVDRCQYIAAHYLTRSLLASYTGEAPEKLRFCREIGRRPELLGKADLRFSLSRTRSLVACALIRKNILGLDVESLDRCRAGLEIAQSCFAPSEIAQVQQWGQNTFLRLWTLKEAFLKATGQGLSRPLDSFCFSLDPIRVDDGKGGTDWRFAQFSPLAGHQLAVALQDAGPGEALIETQEIKADAW